MGDTLRRAAAKCLLGVDPDALAEYFDPFQFAVSIPNGTDVIIHRVRKWRREATPGECVVQIDFNNAFNNIDRSAMLHAISDSFPDFLHYARPAHCTLVTLRSSQCVVYSKETPAVLCSSVSRCTH